MRDKHYRRDNRRDRHKNYPGLDFDGKKLSEIRRQIRGRDRRDDDDTEEVHDDGR